MYNEFGKTITKESDPVRQSIIQQKKLIGRLYKYFSIYFETFSLLFTRHCPARCFGMNMPKSRDIQAKIPLPQAIWNEFWLRYCERSEQ